MMESALYWESALYGKCFILSNLSLDYKNHLLLIEKCGFILEKIYLKIYVYHIIYEYTTIVISIIAYMYAHMKSAPTEIHKNKKMIFEPIIQSFVYL